MDNETLTPEVSRAKRTTRDWLIDLQARIEGLRGDADCLIVSIGVRGPNIDCPDGNAIATVRMGDDTATSEALYLDDAISLARGKIVRERKAREEKRKKTPGDTLPHHPGVA